MKSWKEEGEKIDKKMDIDIFINERNEMIIEIEEKENMRRGREKGIKEEFLSEEENERKKERNDMDLMIRSKKEIDKEEKGKNIKEIIGRIKVEIRKKSRKNLDGLVRVKDIERIRIERWGIDIGWENLEIEVKNVGEWWKMVKKRKGGILIKEKDNEEIEKIERNKEINEGEKGNGNKEKVEREVEMEIEREEKRNIKGKILIKGRKLKVNGEIRRIFI